jgi:hypothetical protein
LTGHESAASYERRERGINGSFVLFPRRTGGGGNGGLLKGKHPVPVRLHVNDRPAFLVRFGGQCGMDERYP